jgi:hypothetical protein
VHALLSVCDVLVGVNRAPLNGMPTCRTRRCDHRYLCCAGAETLIAQL